MSMVESASRLRNLVDSSDRIVGFTGAGVSTDSGIPDYRSQGGIWSRYQPVYFDEFRDSVEKRLLYWRRKWELWPAIANAEPGPGHRFFVELHRLGKLRGVITQNIDGLHEKSGLPEASVVNLHGTALVTGCLDCGYKMPSQTVYEAYDLDEGAPSCPECGGLLKPATISFGQNLEAETIERAHELTIGCDLFIAMGSTLVVYPAASFPANARDAGAKLVIITLSETPLDDSADLCMHQPIADVVSLIL